MTLPPSRPAQRPTRWLFRSSPITSYDAATSGSVENEVKYTYDAWGNATKIEQDRDLVVGGSGTAAYDVDFSYDERGITEATSVFTRIHRTKIAYPNSTELSFYFGNGTLDTIGLPTQVSFMMGRVAQVKIKPSGGSDVVEAMYEYLGSGHVTRTDLPVPEM